MKKHNQVKTDLIPFNEWSKQRIAEGRKICTSRHKKYLHDPRVHKIEKLCWGTIRENYWREEGANSPEELQDVIESIYKRAVGDMEEFYLHWGNFK